MSNWYFDKSRWLILLYIQVNINVKQGISSVTEHIVHNTQIVTIHSLLYSITAFPITAAIG